jgi:hypothetical protein
MPVEFIGYIGTQHQSEIHPAQGPVIDRDYVERVARAMTKAASTAPWSPSARPRRKASWSWPTPPR